MEHAVVYTPIDATRMQTCTTHYYEEHQATSHGMVWRHIHTFRVIYAPQLFSGVPFAEGITPI